MDRGELRDEVLYYIDEHGRHPAILSGRLIRKTFRGGPTREATQADVDAWPDDWAPIDFAPWDVFADGSRPVRKKP